jgi:hypothetical protein
MRQGRKISQRKEILSLVGQSNNLAHVFHHHRISGTFPPNLEFMLCKDNPLVSELDSVYLVSDWRALLVEDS